MERPTTNMIILLDCSPYKSIRLLFPQLLSINFIDRSWGNSNLLDLEDRSWIKGILRIVSTGKIWFRATWRKRRIDCWRTNPIYIAKWCPLLCLFLTSMPVQWNDETRFPLSGDGVSYFIGFPLFQLLGALAFSCLRNDEIWIIVKKSRKQNWRKK